MNLDEINELLKPNFDEHGLIGHIQDGGQFNGSDSCQRTMTYHVFLKLLNDKTLWLEFARAWHQFKDEKGRYRRHPGLGYTCSMPGYPDHACWNDVTNFSGDQGRPVIVALSYYGFKYALLDFLVDTLKNFSRFPNGDACFLAEYGLFIRGLNAWYLYPVLWVCDFWLCLTNILTVTKYYVSVVHSNLTGSFISTDGYINGLVMSLNTNLNLPTPFGLLARKIIKIKCEDAWDYYFRHEGAPMLNLFIPLIKKFL